MMVDKILLAFTIFAHCFEWVKHDSIYEIILFHLLFLFLVLHRPSKKFSRFRLNFQRLFRMFLWLAIDFEIFLEIIFQLIFWVWGRVMWGLALLSLFLKLIISQQVSDNHICSIILFSKSKETFTRNSTIMWQPIDFLFGYYTMWSYFSINSDIFHSFLGKYDSKSLIMIARSITQKNIENIIAVLFNQTLSHDSVSSSLISDRRKAEDFPRLLFLQAPGCLCATFFSEIYTIFLL